jgi:hypothetical protein
VNKTISHVSQLPAWFSLEKYDSAKELNAAGWYLQFCARSIYSHHFEKLDDELRLILLAKHNEEVEQIRNEGVIKNEIHRHAGIFSGLAVYELTLWEQLLITTELLSSIGGGDELFRKVRNIEADLSMPESKWEYLTDEEYQTLQTPLSESADIGGQIYLAVDWSLPDCILMQQFKSLIEVKRAKHSEDNVKQQRRPDFNGWVRAGVLPYIDLKYWAKSQGVQITNRCMADAIFPHGEGGEEVVRKTTKVIAEKLFDRSNMRLLMALSEGDKSETGAL